MTFTDSLRKNFMAVSAVLLLIVVGALILLQPQANGQSSLPKVDVGIASLEFQSPDSLMLGSPANVTVSLLSTNDSAKYRLMIKANDELVHDQAYWGTKEVTVAIPVLEDGLVNVTATVYLSDKAQFQDTNASNEVVHTQVYVNPLVPAKAPQNSSLANSTVIHSERMYAAPLTLENDAYIYAIGMSVRKNAVMSAESLFRYTLHKDINGTPEQNATQEFSVQLVRISDNWSLLLLAAERKKIDAGNYWVVASATEGGYAEIQCYDDISNSSLTGKPSEFGDRWSEYNCTPYMIVSSLSPKTVDENGEYYLPKQFYE